MEHLDALREALPESARDLKLNIQNVLARSSLSPAQALGVGLSSAFFVGCDALRDALLADAREAGIGDEVIEDARAAAALMAMNTVYYRFRHLVEKPSYAQKPAQLRMQRMMKPATSKADFELFSMACAALAGCAVCMKAHEASILKAGGSEDQVHDAVRIASVVNGVATGLRLGA